MQYWPLGGAHTCNHPMGPVGRVPSNLRTWGHFCWGQRLVTADLHRRQTKFRPTEKPRMRRFHQDSWGPHHADWIKEGKCMEEMG